VSVAAAGFDLIVVSEVWVDAGLVVELDLRLSLAPAGSTLLLVRSTLPSGRAIEGAQVTVDGGAQQGLTDANGQVWFALDEGEHALSATPPAAVGAFPRGLPAVRAWDGVVNRVELIHSGRAPAGATYRGSESCEVCHPERSALHGLSAHARSWSTQPGPGLDQALSDGAFIETTSAAGVPIELRLVRDLLGDRLRMLGPEGPVAFDIAGYLGASSQVPLLQLPTGLVPAPMVWRTAGSGLDSPPVVREGLGPFSLERWVDADGSFVRHPATDGPRPADLLAAACLGCHAIGFELSELGGVVASSALGGGGALADELGVGCEACHGPCSEHNDAAAEVQADLVLSPAKLDPEKAAEVCAQCHGRGEGRSGFTSAIAYPYAGGDYEPALELDAYRIAGPVEWASGHAAAANQQSDDFGASLHASGGLLRMRCWSCHEAHGGSDPSVPAQLVDDPRDNGLCLACHEALHFSGPADPAHHAAHRSYTPADDSTPAGRCVSCHMPRTAQRLGWSAFSGAGHLASHRFEPLPPRVTMDAFDGAGSDRLPPGQYPPDSCSECHLWSAEFYLGRGQAFPGPVGAPGVRGTYQSLQGGWEALFR
jgi:predicted CXXCH cytochrome family protein